MAGCVLFHKRCRPGVKTETGNWKLDTGKAMKSSAGWRIEKGWRESEIRTLQMKSRVSKIEYQVSNNEYQSPFLI